MPIPDKSPAEMTADERLKYVNDNRRRFLAGEVLTDEELRFTLEVLQVQRASRETASSRKRANAAPALTLDDI